MTPDLSPLQVRGAQIVDSRGQAVQLRGVCLGGWLNMENFILGYPGHESGARSAIADVLGPDLARYFFERFLHHFIGREDLAFIRSLGCNVVRVPFNYRHFESDDRPFEHLPEGFSWLDRAIGWARDEGLYVILDLHAAPGWQSRGWHCDNPCRQALFWAHPHFEDRAVALWEALARRYRGEPVVAGYNVLNEPDTDWPDRLNRFYRRVMQAIRAIDTDHILYLEGNRTSQDFECLEPPFDANTVYSSHNYVEPGLNDVDYPGTLDGVVYDRDRLERDYRVRAAYMLRHGVPNWVGEFGVISNGPTVRPAHVRLLGDMMSIIEAHGHHWTLWTYKDIGKMGVVLPRGDCEWMRRTRPVREIKQALRCDYWVERRPSAIDDHLEALRQHAGRVTAGQPVDMARLPGELSGAVNEVALAQALLPAFAEQFRGMTETEIDRMMEESFAFRNCAPRPELVTLFRSRLGASA